MSFWSRKPVRVVIFLVAAVLIFMAGWVSHDLGVYRSVKGPRGPRYGQQFTPLAKAFHDYLREHDGFIPADPYRALVESGKVTSFSDFLFDGHYAVPEPLMPVRVNPNLEENPRFPLLLWFYDTWWNSEFDPTMHSESYVWVAWADGTVTHERVAAGSPYIEAFNRWEGLYKEAGYPNLLAMPFAERAKWIADHRDQLMWDAALRIYVLPQAATATAP